jgi:broad specificity phosphatase PhoE
MHRFVNWFVPRAISMLSRHPQTFKLLLRELRGSFAGPKLYRRSQAEAVKLGDAFPVALRAGSKTRRARESADKVTREIDLAKVDDALVGLVGAEHVRLLVRAREQFVGEVTIAVHDESVGLDRLHDAIAIAFGTHFLAIDLDKARRESLAIVKKRFGNL